MDGAGLTVAQVDLTFGKVAEQVRCQHIMHPCTHAPTQLAHTHGQPAVCVCVGGGGMRVGISARGNVLGLIVEWHTRASRQDIALAGCLDDGYRLIQCADSRRLHPRAACCREHASSLSSSSCRRCPCWQPLADVKSRRCRCWWLLQRAQCGAAPRRCLSASTIAGARREGLGHPLALAQCHRNSFSQEHLALSTMLVSIPLSRALNVVFTPSCHLLHCGSSLSARCAPCPL